MPQAPLSTARLLLTPLAPEHLDHEIELDTDPQVMRYLFNGRPRPRADIVEAHHRRLVVAQDHPGLGYWTGFLDGAFVGWWVLLPVLDDGVARPDEAEVGYRLLPRFWRQGLASEGSIALLHQAFTGLGLQRVIAQTMAVNEASRATMSKIGLRYLRTFHETWDEPIAGYEHGEVEYAVSRDEWLAKHPA
ncbi:GNAT family N-acetyltransferase [Kineosporia rhizophila]|uniref:GNAT family N-acetyltransferase n=1 Tax=Kineosporia rhizophila TaxID=84633 RepID=UPI001E338FDE|nr:GNAT family N-acetyltransferase [Kineosporia rhizophila]MCE0536315.1 GNAT family N-acetyltransferase [Kineosporia rhizophila]